MIKQNRRFNVSVIKTKEVIITKLFENHVRPPENYGYRGKRGQAKNKDKSIYTSMQRAKKKIFGYTLANDWDLWGTLTLDKIKIDRYDLDLIQTKLNKYLQNTKRRKYPNLAWLIVPEQHKDGAWHFHLLLNGLPFEELRYINKTYKNTERKMYNWIDYETKFGFNSFIDVSTVSIEEKYKISNYLTKYITKAFCEARYNKKKYWSSKGLAEPNKYNTLLNYEEYKKALNIDNIHSNDIIHQSEYYVKDRLTGEIINKVKEITRVLPF